MGWWRHQIENRLKRGQLQPEELNLSRNLDQLGIYVRSHLFSTGEEAVSVLKQLSNNIYANTLANKIARMQPSLANAPVTLSYVGKVRASLRGIPRGYAGEGLR